MKTLYLSIIDVKKILSFRFDNIPIRAECISRQGQYFKLHELFLIHLKPFPFPTLKGVEKLHNPQPSKRDNTISWNNFPKPDLTHIIEKVIMKKYLKIMGELLNNEEYGDARSRNITHLCQRR